MVETTLAMVEVEITMVLAKVAKALEEEAVVAVEAVPMVGVEEDLVMEALGIKLNCPRYQR